MNYKAIVDRYNELVQDAVSWRNSSLEKIKKNLEFYLQEHGLHEKGLYYRYDKEPVFYLVEDLFDIESIRLEKLTGLKKVIEVHTVKKKILMCGKTINSDEIMYSKLVHELDVLCRTISGTAQTLEAEVYSLEELRATHGNAWGYVVLRHLREKYEVAGIDTIRRVI